MPILKKPAKLYYLMGASGSGKDSILRYYREHKALSKDQPVLIAHRYITRAGDANENAIHLTPEEFALRQGKDLFSLYWQANDLHYGIGIEIDAWLSSGASVLVNGSRAYLPTAQAKYPEYLHSINVEVADHLLKARLQTRNRESQAMLEQRLHRHQTLKGQLQADSEIVNNDSLEQAVMALEKIIHG